MKFFNYVFFIFPIKKNRVVITSFFGNTLSGDLFYVFHELAKNKKYEIILLSKKKIEVSALNYKNVKVVKRFSLKEFYYMATAKLWIDNSRKPYYFTKRKSQLYIQYWHSILGFKQSEAGAIDSLTSEYINLAKKDSAQIDYIVSGNGFMTDFYKNFFWYNGEIVELGNPSNDLFINANYSDKLRIKKRLGLSSDVKIFLYGPTFRTNANIEDVIFIDFDNLKKALEDRFGGEWVILVRLHPNLKGKSFFKFGYQWLIDVTSYDDMSELILVSDAVMTDYSSWIFQSLFMNKKGFIYSSDYDSYDRDFLIDPKSSPFIFSSSSNELIQKIINFSEDNYLAGIEKFMNKINFYENGNSLNRNIKFIDKLLTKE